MTPRYLRHFNLVSVTPFDDDSLFRIFDTILAWWCKRARLSETLTQQRGHVVHASVAAYRAVQAGLLPTPTKSHYTFNLRDLSKVMQVSMGDCIPLHVCRLMLTQWRLMWRGVWPPSV